MNIVSQQVESQWVVEGSDIQCTVGIISGRELHGRVVGRQPYTSIVSVQLW